MLLFQELIFALCVSVFVSLFFTTVCLFYRGKTTSSVVEVAERVKELHKVELCNEFSEDGIHSGDECERHVFNECSVRPGWLVDVGHVVGAEMGGVGLVRDMVNEGRVGSECDESACEDNLKRVEKVKDLVRQIHKEGISNGIELKDHVLGGKSRGTFMESVENEGDVEAIEVAVLEKEILEVCVSGRVEFDGHIVDETLDRLKDQRFMTKSEEYFNNEEELPEVEVLESQILEKIVSSGIEFEENLVDERPERANNRGFMIKSEKKDNTKIFNEEDYDDEGWLDDWEGIESTELEKRFGDAAVFVGSKGNANRISSLNNEVKMQLYGLHKVSIEGPCRIQQPMALKVSARAKWKAWHLLGDMSRAVAMEQYIALLSKSLPEWSGDDAKEKE